MKTHVLYFAVIRERLKRDRDEVELPAGATVGQLMAHLAGREPAVAALRAHLKVAVNQAMVGDDHALRDGDEVALIPPVSGGACCSR